MEGALLVIKSWALVGSLLWLYRRYIERVARPDAEFEAWCRGAPRIAALRGESADLASVEAALGLLLGRRSRVIATLGGCPWPDYELELRVTLRGSALELSVVRAELRRVHGATPPSLVTVLRDALNEHPAISDAWLLSETVYGKLGPDEAPHGWQLLPGLEARPQLLVRTTAPEWLEPPSPTPDPERHPSQVSPKLLPFGGKC